jgi:hypothetical protein
MRLLLHKFRLCNELKSIDPSLEVALRSKLISDRSQNDGTCCYVLVQKVPNCECVGVESFDLLWVKNLKILMFKRSFVLRYETQMGNRHCENSKGRLEDEVGRL